MYKLNMLGWTQEEIAEKVSLDQSVVARIVQKTDFGKMHNEFESGKPIEKIAYTFFGYNILSILP